MAIANYPFLYCFAGRNNIIATFTGISYQVRRFSPRGVLDFVLLF